MKLTVYSYLLGCLIFSLVLLICLFGSLPEYQDSLIARLRRLLLKIPESALAIDRKYFGRAVHRSSLRFYNSYSHELGYLVPLGYAIMIGVFLFLFFRDTRPLMEERNPITNFYIYLSAAMPFVSVILCVISDPGKIRSNRAHSFALWTFPYDRILFYPGTPCRTCRFERPARSKHCSSCRACIMMRDHHCIWINNCVGYRNIRWFLLFLVSNLNMVIQGTYYSLEVLNSVRKAEFSDESLFSGFFNTFYLTNSLTNTGAILIICFLTSLLTLPFLAIHLRYIYQGTTTSESAMWEDIESVMKDGGLFIYEFQNEQDKLTTREAGIPSIVLQREDDGTWHRQLTPQEFDLVRKYKMTPRQVRTYSDLHNIYDEGLWKNFKNVLWPKSC